MFEGAVPIFENFAGLFRFMVLVQQLLLFRV